MSDFLFNISDIPRDSPIARRPDCTKCHGDLRSASYRKYDKPFLLQNGTRGKVLFVGTVVTQYADMLNKPICPEFTADVLGLLSGYAVYYVPSVVCPLDNGTYPGVDKQNAYAKCCQPVIYDVIKDFAPDFIVAFGNAAVSSLYTNRTKAGCNINIWRGSRIPDQRLGAWVICTHDMMGESSDGESGVLWRMIKADIALIPSAPKFPKYGDLKDKVKILSSEQAIAYLNALPDNSTIALDYETSGLKPDNVGHFIECVGVRSSEDSYSVCFQYNELVRAAWVAVLQNPNIKKIAHNLKMEDRWSLKIVGTPVAGWIWDSCLAAHCINTTQPSSGLKFQSLLRFGIEDYSDDVHEYLTAPDSNSLNNISACDKKTLYTYCGIDAWLTFELYPIQVGILSSWKNLLGGDFVEGAAFFTNTARAFSIMEDNGVLLDKALMQKFSEEIATKIVDAETRFKATGVYSEWERQFGQKTNLGSDDQLRKLLFGKMKFKPTTYTERGLPAVDEDSLTDVPLDGLGPLIELRKLNKIVGTYYAQFNREATDKSRVHCVMTLNSTRTFRSSCTNPNLQNISNRDKDAARYIRSLLLPDEKGWCICEADLKGCEVSGTACHTKDRNLIAYVSDSSLDMHRDVGTVICHCDKDMISKEIRGILKMYTFGSFYGSYWKKTAPLLWKQFTIHQPSFTDGTPIFDYFASHNIPDLERFTSIVQDADNYFWNEQFPEFKAWKEAQWDLYLSQGYVDMFTGFRRVGPLSRNQAINTPIQGDSGHINMWLCQYVLAQIKRTGIRARLFMQIHDSVLAVVHHDDLAQYCKFYKTGIELLRKRWEWMIVPFPVEFEVAPPGMSWFDKKEYVV